MEKSNFFQTKHSRSLNFWTKWSTTVVGKYYGRYVSLSVNMWRYLWSRVTISINNKRAYYVEDYYYILTSISSSSTTLGKQLQQTNYNLLFGSVRPIMEENA